MHAALCLLIVLILNAISVYSTFKKKMTFTVPAGKTTCLLKRASKKQVIEMEYQVLDSTGDRSKMSILFELLMPKRRRVTRGTRLAVRNSAHSYDSMVAAKRRWPAGAHILNVTVPGPYQFCFDNSADKKSNRTILFDLTVRPNERVSLAKSLINEKTEKTLTDKLVIPLDKKTTTQLRDIPAKSKYECYKELFIPVTVKPTVSLPIMPSLAREENREEAQRKMEFDDKTTDRIHRSENWMLSYRWDTIV